jgi:hypothetical protein
MKEDCYPTPVPILAEFCTNSIHQIIIAGVINAHVAAKFVYVRMFRGTRHMSQRTWLSVGTWIAITLTMWVIAWIIAESIPVFEDLLALISSLFASWYVTNFQHQCELGLQGTDIGSPQVHVRSEWCFLVVPQQGAILEELEEGLPNNHQLLDLPSRSRYLWHRPLRKWGGDPVGSRIGSDLELLEQSRHDIKWHGRIVRFPSDLS